MGMVLYHAVKRRDSVKRILLLLLVSLFIPCCVFAESDEFAVIHETFASHTIDDLLLLKKIVEIELEYRGYYTETKEVSVPPGTYTIGADIPANVYSLSLDGSIVSMITIKNADGSLVTMHALNASTTNIGKIDLTDGQVIEIVGEPVIFKPYVGIGF